ADWKVVRQTSLRQSANADAQSEFTADKADQVQSVGEERGRAQSGAVRIESGCELEQRLARECVTAAHREVMGAVANAEAVAGRRQWIDRLLGQGDRMVGGQRAQGFPPDLGA